VAKPGVLAKWQTPRSLGRSYLRLSVERWVGASGKHGWGTDGDPFPGNVTIRIYELDQSKPEKRGDLGKETTKDDLIATCRGRLEVHPAWEPYRGKDAALRKLRKTNRKKYRRVMRFRYAALFRPDQDGVKDPAGNPIRPGGRQARGIDSRPRDWVWVNFEGQELKEAYLLEIPADPSEKEGEFFEIAFRISPDDKSAKPYTAKADFSRRREVLLAVEPLGQGNWGSLRKKSRMHRRIIQYYHRGKWDTANRKWANMVVRAHRFKYGVQRFGPAGCSIVSFTMVVRYLTRPGTEKSIYDHFVGKVTHKGTRLSDTGLDPKFAPYERLPGGRYRKRLIREYWWPVYLVWYARQKGGYREELSANKRRLVHHYDRGQDEMNKWITGYGRIHDKSTALLADLGLSSPTVKKGVTSRNWATHETTIKDALDDGLPVMGLVRSGQSAHWIVFVGYRYERGKLRLIMNNCGKGVLRHPAAGSAGGVPHDIKRGGAKHRPLVKYIIFKPSGWDRAKHAKFARPVLVGVQTGPVKAPQGVAKVTGPKSVLDCMLAEYKVGEFVRTPASSSDKEAVRWKVKVDGNYRTVQEQDQRGVLDAAGSTLDDYQGETLQLAITEELANKEILVMAYLNRPSEKVSVKTKVVWTEVARFIFRVRELEAANPAWTGVNVLDCLRRVAGYDDLKFRTMYGGDPPLPRGRALTPARLRGDLERYTSHRGNTAANETGIARERGWSAHAVAMGHVLTGISGGLHRKKSMDFPYLYAKASGRSWTDQQKAKAGGHKLDNLYAVTLAGDLGQSAYMVNEGKQTSYIGYGTEATYAEIVGDMDGMNIALNLRHLTGGKSLRAANGARLSEVLLAYYCSRTSSKVNRTNRFRTFIGWGYGKLETETHHFAVNYAYGKKGGWSGFWTETKTQAKESFEKFEKWLKRQKDSPWPK
jgi:hypothetical protein